MFIWTCPFRVCVFDHTHSRVAVPGITPCFDTLWLNVTSKFGIPSLHPETSWRCVIIIQHMLDWNQSEHLKQNCWGSCRHLRRSFSPIPFIFACNPRRESVRGIVGGLPHLCQAWVAWHLQKTCKHKFTPTHKHTSVYYPLPHRHTQPRIPQHCVQC